MTTFHYRFVDVLEINAQPAATGSSFQTLVVLSAHYKAGYDAKYRIRNPPDGFGNILSRTLASQPPIIASRLPAEYVHAVF